MVLCCLLVVSFSKVLWPSGLNPPMSINSALLMEQSPAKSSRCCSSFDLDNGRNCIPNTMLTSTATTWTTCSTDWHYFLGRFFVSYLAVLCFPKLCETLTTMPHLSFLPIPAVPPLLKPKTQPEPSSFWGQTLWIDVWSPCSSALSEAQSSFGQRLLNLHRPNF